MFSSNPPATRFLLEVFTRLVAVQQAFPTDVTPFVPSLPKHPLTSSPVGRPSLLSGVRGQSRLVQLSSADISDIGRCGWGWESEGLQKWLPGQWWLGP